MPGAPNGAPVPGSDLSPIEAASQAEPAPGETAPPGNPGPRINLRQQRYGLQGTAPQQSPIRRPKVATPAKPAAIDPDRNQTSPSSPTGPAPALPPGTPGGAQVFGPSDNAPLPGATPGEASFPTAPGPPGTGPGEIPAASEGR